ncbi:MAG: hypothetical protein U1E46_13310 [Hyphomicrobiales bacterium]
MDFELLGTPVLSAPRRSRGQNRPPEPEVDIAPAMPLVLIFCVLIGLGFATALGVVHRPSAANATLAHLDLERHAASGGN